MTELPGTRGAGVPRRARGALAAVWLTAAVFLAALAILAVRVAQGSDPALRARAASMPLPARRVLVRKIYERKVVVHLPPSAPPQPPQASQQVSAAGGYPSTLPVTRTS